ncbi:MAG: TraR/DksA family transcriptional regulator [Candidatus Omnitrophota bacterium]|nr:TraR/DksA family transcriptional regulator [Candidatus Omnitrophota bacterium]
MAKKTKAAKAKKISGAKRNAKIKKMPKDELKKYKEQLLAERKKVEGDISHIAENTLHKSKRDASGDLSGYSYHMADMASDDYDRDFSLGRVTDEQKVLYAIDEALKRITDGAYGLCLQCDKPISKNRLKALPYTELCIDCQKKTESK